MRWNSGVAIRANKEAIETIDLSTDTTDRYRHHQYYRQCTHPVSPKTHDSVPQIDTRAQPSVPREAHQALFRKAVNSFVYPTYVESFGLNRPKRTAIPPRWVRTVWTSKSKMRACCFVFGFGHVDHLATDSGVTRSMLHTLRDSGFDVVVV